MARFPIANGRREFVGLIAGDVGRVRHEDIELLPDERRQQVPAPKLHGSPQLRPVSDFELGQPGEGDVK